MDWNPRPGARPRATDDLPGAARRRGRRPVDDTLAALVLALLVGVGGWLLLDKPAEPPLPPPPPSTLSADVVGPPTRESARYQAQYRPAPTIEEYETVRAARF